MSALLNKVKSLGHNEKESTTSTHHNTTDAATPSYSSAGDRSAVDSTTTPSTTAAGDRSTNLTSSSTTPSSKVGVAETEIARGEEHLREHAHPPAHHHNQPKRDGLLDEAGAKAATHDHQHLAPVTHETHKTHEVEEVERQREIDRHVHHVQHHVQPVLDTQHASEQHHQKIVPETHIKENHVATDEDKANFAALNTARDEFRDAGKEKVIIDKGERVHENKHDVVHHLVQPIIERDTHDHVREHTTVPIHQTVHEAPIVHQSTVHEPLRIDEFTQGGGDLSSKLRHDANLLNVTGKDCERTVDGPAETLVSNLGLGSGSTTTSSAAAPTSATTGSSAAGTTGGTL
ncbi:hypothetical protein JCM8097_002469 [Rhodosporidiobolus ruineniae]